MLKSLTAILLHKPAFVKEADQKNLIGLLHEMNFTGLCFQPRRSSEISLNAEIVSQQEDIKNLCIFLGMAGVGLQPGSKLTAKVDVKIEQKDLT
jgi:hypothetical protein